MSLHYHVGITPAHAGNTVSFLPTAADQWDHPRTRGEYDLRSGDNSRCKGSPPHTRGILQFFRKTSRSPGITPAHAGNTECRRILQNQIGDHPRTRGEYGLSKNSGPLGLGSPPHTRGILVAQRYRWRRDGITPAHAGNTASIASATCSVGDHPRTRGEYLHHIQM